MHERRLVYDSLHIQCHLLMIQTMQKADMIELLDKEEDFYLRSRLETIDLLTF